MKKNELEKKISKVLDEEETFMLSLILLAHMHKDEKYQELSDLIFLFDNYKGFKQLIKYYEGQTITIPTVMELKQALRLLTLFQKVYLDNKDFNKCYEELNIVELGLTQEYCRNELSNFKNLLRDDGSYVLNKIRKLSKKNRGNE